MMIIICIQRGGTIIADCRLSLHAREEQQVHKESVTREDVVGELNCTEYWQRMGLQPAAMLLFKQG